MNILIKSAKIIDPNSKYHEKIMDVFVKDGKIKKIAKSIKDTSIKEKNIKKYHAKNLHVSPGWFDLHANFGEPGYEQRETLETGSNAALKGGFTGVMVMPNTNPNIDNKSIIEYIQSATKNSIIDIIPAGNITKGGKGEEIVEMHDMNRVGCKAFTDDKKSVSKNNVMKIALLYSKDVDILIMNYPSDKEIASDGCMHEGITSTLLGIKGIPALAEELMVDRDLNLCKYTNSKIHLSYISTRNSVKKVKEAKKKKIEVTTDVALHNLFLTDESLNNFDTRYKVMPPLRTNKDVNALIKALQDGTIDVICTDHSPINDEDKKIDFDSAANGIIGLETAFGALGKYILPKIDLSTLIEKIAINPRKVLKIKEVVIREGENANLTLFDPHLEWEFKVTDIQSKSSNSPFIGEKLKGKALAIFNHGKFKEC